MSDLKSKITKILAIWTGIGVLLTTLGASGIIEIPSNFIDIFSQDTADKISIAINSVLQAWGSVLVVAQIIRGGFVFKKEEGGVSIKSFDVKKMVKSPFAF